MRHNVINYNLIVLSLVEVKITALENYYYYKYSWAKAKELFHFVSKSGAFSLNFCWRFNYKKTPSSLLMNQIWPNVWNYLHIMDHIICLLELISFILRRAIQTEELIKAEPSRRAHLRSSSSGLHLLNNFFIYNLITRCLDHYWKLKISKLYIYIF